MNQPKSSALPVVSDLNNLSAWAEHLKKTEFVPVLWVNAEVQHEVCAPHNGHITIAGQKEILSKLPDSWKKNVDYLCQRVGSDNVILWQTRRPNNKYKYFPKKMGVLVVNVENFFSFAARTDPNFDFMREMFQHLLQQRLFYYIKDFLVDFLIGYLSGFYFDLDFSPGDEPFFSNMAVVCNLFRDSPNAEQLLQYGEIFTILKKSENGLMLGLSVSMMVNVAAKDSDLRRDREREYYWVPAYWVDQLKDKVTERYKASAKTLRAEIQQKTLNELEGYTKLYRENPVNLASELKNVSKKKKQPRLLPEVSGTELGKKYKDLLYFYLQNPPRSIFDSFCMCIKYIDEGRSSNHEVLEMRDWLETTYQPFYERYFYNKFSQMDFYLPSRVHNSGFYSIKERIDASAVLTKHNIQAKTKTWCIRKKCAEIIELRKRENLAKSSPMRQEMLDIFCWSTCWFFHFNSEKKFEYGKVFFQLLVATMTIYNQAFESGTIVVIEDGQKILQDFSKLIASSQINPFECSRQLPKIYSVLRYSDWTKKAPSELNIKIYKDLANVYQSSTTLARHVNYHIKIANPTRDRDNYIAKCVWHVCQELAKNIKDLIDGLLLNSYDTKDFAGQTIEEFRSALSSVLKTDYKDMWENYPGSGEFLRINQRLYNYLKTIIEPGKSDRWGYTKPRSQTYTTTHWFNSKTEEFQSIEKVLAFLKDLHQRLRFVSCDNSENERNWVQLTGAFTSYLRLYIQSNTTWPALPLR